MVSFDVESLFTIVPVNETIQLILDKLFPDNDTIFNGFNRQDFKKLLDLAVQDTVFLFNDKAYTQIDGMAMGSPLGPIFAGIFMSSLEEYMLDNCPLQYHPLFYKRYVDDTFALFKTNFDAERFLTFINTLHPNIKFTIEYENNDQLPFLDILVTRHQEGFSTSVYRKQTFTGSGTNFYSFCFFNFKLNSLMTLLHRALTHTSNWQAFHEEIAFLRNHFVNNCFPSALFHKSVHKFLNNVFIPRHPIHTVQKNAFLCEPTFYSQ